MEELRYLKDKQKTPGPAPFVTQATYPVPEGHARLWVYDLFPGVEWMVTDFACETCFQKGMEQDVVCIHHCERGRFECAFDCRNYVYMGEGDIAISSMLRPPIGASFPLRRYFGSTIALIPTLCDKVPELAAFGISARELFQRYALAQSCRVFRRSGPVERLYQEMYASLHHPQLPFLRLKLVELLFHFQNGQATLEENRDYIPKSVTEKIKHVKDHLLEDAGERLPLPELAREHGLSLTQLKTGFKQIYGETPYAYCKRYKMHQAAALLLSTGEKVSDIAQAVGYQNASKFSQAFRSVMGVTPLQYRRRTEQP